MTTRYQAVLFDLDGTLADTLSDLAESTNHALAALGFPTHPVDAYRHFVGDGTHSLLRRALPPGQERQVDEAVRRMRAVYAEHCYDQTRLYPGIGDLVRDLDQRGLKLAVLSNKPDHFTREMVEHYFQPSPFDLVRGHLASVPLKPDPTAARQIAEELGVRPSAWIYLGDTNTDMQTARAAGMFAVGALWGFRDREELLNHGAQAIVETPAQVLGLL